MEVVGFFNLSGKLEGINPSQKLLTLRFFVKGVTGEVLERRVSLDVPEGELYRIGHEWIRDGSLLVSGTLWAVQDNLHLRANVVHLLRDPKPLFLNEAVLWATVKERLSETVYSLIPQEGKELVFPVESSLPLMEGRTYYLKGSLSPRYYPRLNFWQNRFKVHEIHELLATLRVGGRDVLGIR